MGILSKHLGVGEPLKIGEDEIMLKPLGTEAIPYFIKAMKAFSGAQDENATVEEMLKNVDDDGLNAIRKLIDDTLAISLPGEPESDRKTFGLKYMMTLLPKIIEINMQTLQTKEQTRKDEIIKRIKEKRNAESKGSDKE